MQFYDKSARGLVKILRCAQDDSVGAWIGVILIGAAVLLHATSARKETLFMVLCPKGGGFQARGSGFLWSRARKGAVLGTGVASVRPDVPKASGQRRDMQR